jgi:prepilin-type N-terminal cleavage/methylation domain-containing protein
MSSNRSGFTVVEMILAIVILSIGLLALAAGSGSVTRTLHGSRIATQAAHLAGERMDMLRAYARATIPPCTHAQFIPSASAVVLHDISQTWNIVADGATRRINVVSTYAIGRGQTRTDTLSSTVACNN